MVNDYAELLSHIQDVKHHACQLEKKFRGNQEACKIAAGMNLWHIQLNIRILRWFKETMDDATEYMHTYSKNGDSITIPAIPLDRVDIILGELERKMRANEFDPKEDENGNQNEFSQDYDYRRICK